MSSIYNKVMHKVAKEDKKNSNKPTFKTSTVLGEWAASQLGNILVPSIAQPASTAGRLVGLFTPDASEKDVSNYSNTSFIPGIGSYRAVKRNQLLDKKYSKGKRRNSAMVSEAFGGFPTVLASTAIGGVLGHLADRNKLLGEEVPKHTGLLSGIGIGAGVGGASELIAYLAGLLNKKTKKEHEDYLADDHLVAKNLLIPFRGLYNLGRRERSLLSETL